MIAVMNSELWAEIRRLSAIEKLSKSAIAARLRIDRKTVRRALASEQTPGPRAAAPRPAKLDAFKSCLQSRLKEYPELSAAKLLLELKRMGYHGGYTQLKEYLATLRPKANQTYLRIETLPGEQAQVDWANCGSIRVGSALRKLSAFVMVLACSRMLYLEFTLSQCLEDFLAAHLNAFRFFGGIPKKILYDNLKTVVLSRVGRDIRFNPKFLDFAGYHLFEPVPCAPGKGNEKGKVENGIKYIRTSCLAGYASHPGRTSRPTRALGATTRPTSAFTAPPGSAPSTASRPKARSSSPSHRRTTTSPFSGPSRPPTRPSSSSTSTPIPSPGSWPPSPSPSRPPPTISTSSTATVSSPLTPAATKNTSISKSPSTVAACWPPAGPPTPTRPMTPSSL